MTQTQLTEQARAYLSAIGRRGGKAHRPLTTEQARAAANKRWHPEQVIDKGDAEQDAAETKVQKPAIFGHII